MASSQSSGSSSGGANKQLSPIDEVKSPETHVIREVYDSSNAQETFELDLEKALVAKINYIIIEPQRLGDETGRWIAVGNCLNQTAVFSGLLSVASGITWPERPYIFAPLCTLSIVCTSLYAVSWNCDPCCQYQVEKDPKVLEKLANLNEFSSPVVLAYKSNKKAKYVQRSVTILAAAFCAWRIYESCK